MIGIHSHNKPSNEGHDADAPRVALLEDVKAEKYAGKHLPDGHYGRYGPHQLLVRLHYVR